MEKRLRIGVRVPPCRPAHEVADFAVVVEEAGFDELHVPDSQTLWRDAFLTLYAIGRQTSRLRLATTVSNVVTRHPSVLAGLARTLDEVAPNRIVIGLGVGDSSVRPIGVAPSTASDLRRGVEEIRRLVRGEEVAYGDAVARLRDPRPGGVPVHIAATGPRNLRMAGETGDGVILLSGVAQAPLRHALAKVRAGAETSGRRFEDLEITVTAHAMVTDDVQRDARILKPIVAAIAQRGGSSALAIAGIDIQVPRHVPEVTPDLVHAEDWEHAVAVCSRWVSDEDAVTYAKTFGLFGTAEDIVGQLRSVRALGVTGVLLQHVGSWDLPEALVRDTADEVLPLLAEAR